MFKKNTQNLKKLIWQNSLLALVLLLSMNISSQDIGDEYLVNPGINSATGANTTTPDTGVDGGGNMPAHLGGWGAGGGGAYASASAGNGDCHSADRMFKFFKKGGSLGQFVYQDVTLPVGRFNWSFWTKWAVVVDYDAGAAEKPTFTIETDDDQDGTWTVVQTTITTEPTTTNTWVQQTGTFDNPIERQVRIKFYKLGGTTAAQTNLNQLMFVDDVSLNYAGAITTTTDDTTLADLTIDGSTVTGFTPSGTTYAVELAPGTTVVPTVAATLYNTNGSSVITAATSLPGTTTIVITAEDGATQRTVSINFTVQALTAGQEFLVNPGINSATGANTTTPDTGVDGSGNMPANLGGWGSGANGSFAPSSAANGNCLSEDRQFKFFKNNNSFVYQDVTYQPETMTGLLILVG